MSVPDVEADENIECTGEMLSLLGLSINGRGFMLAVPCVAPQIFSYAC
jgi:hypothetical protein